MTGINSTVTGKFSDPPVIMTGITKKKEKIGSHSQSR